MLGHGGTSATYSTGGRIMQGIGALIKIKRDLLTMLRQGNVAETSIWGEIPDYSEIDAVLLDLLETVNRAIKEDKSCRQ